MTHSAFTHACCRLLLVLACSLILPACAAAGGAFSYGTKVKFAKGRTLSFADFDLTYTGTRRESSSPFPRGFSFEDFQLSRAGESKTISWSAGTGDIGPVEFDFAGQKFALELRMSDRLGRLGGNELVVWKR